MYIWDVIPNYSPLPALQTAPRKTSLSLVFKMKKKGVKKKGLEQLRGMGRYMFARVCIFVRGCVCSCVRVFECACVHACVRACVRACVFARVRDCVCGCVCAQREKGEGRKRNGK